MTTLSGLSTLASSGVALALPYAAGMQSSLPILQKNYKFSKVFFWGKLAGMTADYLIAKGIEESYEQVKFFFCTDGVSWSQLPAVTPEILEKLGKVATTMLTGDIAAATEVPADPLPEGEEEPAEPPEPVFIKEIERLACMVEEIDKACAMCPAGALMKKPDHTVVSSPTFMGLSYDAACDLGSFVLMNSPKPVDVNASALKQSTDFLTSCTDMVPKGALTKSMDCATNSVTWRSLLYPGFLAYSVIGMPVHGYCYFGTGLKNADIAFMLP